MNRLLSSLLTAGLTLSYVSPAIAQTPGPQRQDTPIIRVGTTEVSLDIVVRDKKGRPVRDLTADDFEILEDGVKQRIESFRFVTRGEAEKAPGGSGRQPKPVGPKTGEPADSFPAVIALVFDRLSPEARALARKAGLAYAADGITAGDYAGVFGIDQALRTIQSYTDDPELIKQAVDRATSTSTSTYVSGTAKVRDLSDRSAALDRQISSSQSEAAAAGANQDSAGASAAGAAIGQAAIQQAFVEMETRILESFEVLERDQQGFATINSLLAVITAMRNLPGRKSIIFFSEGLSLPSSVQTKFPAVISAANLANVSVYAIDAAGLRIESGTAEAAREINALAARRMQQTGRGDDRSASGPYTKALERNEDLLRLDPRSGLGTLADETGGFLISDTNDLGSGLRRIDSDMRGYYLVTYVPKNEDYNGRFRRISVKVNRSNLEAQTRKGYYGIESAGPQPVLDYEAPALAAMRTANAQRNPFAFRSAALDFPYSDHPGLAVILAEAPISAFTLSPSSDQKMYNADFSMVALIKDQSNQIVQKLSQHYPLSGPIDQLEAAKRGNVLFYREVQLRPGSYTVQLVAYDRTVARASLSTSKLEILPAAETTLRVSSVVVLNRAEKLSPEEQKRDQPLHFGELVVYPNMGEPLNKSKVKQLAFFITAWPVKGSTETLKVSLSVLQKGRSIAKSDAELPAADEKGRIRYASAIPLDSFDPGTYELKVTVSDSKNSVSRSAQFLIAP